MINDIAVCIVHFNTPHLVKDCINSFRGFYSEVPIFLVENGSDNKHRDCLLPMLDGDENIFPMLEPINIGHGPAMHKVFQLAEDYNYIFTLDSDCIVKVGGFLEAMRDIAEDEFIYAQGWLRKTNYDGVSYLEGENPTDYIKYIHPCAALFHRYTYLTLPKFTHRGAPCVTNMLAAQQNDIPVREFPIFNYIEHLVAGTRRLYGGNWQVKPGAQAVAWDAHQHYPI